jgi:hypothetical protein
VPPDPLAPLEEWQAYRAGPDALEVRLFASHPDLDWLDGMRALKAGADDGKRDFLRTVTPALLTDGLRIEGGI